MKLLLHMCCGPCSVYPTSVLMEEKIEFKGIYYNPNIHPIDEFKLRMENVKTFSKSKGFEVEYFDDFLELEWLNFNGSNDERCVFCYDTRLDKVALHASLNGFDAFTTTLLVSPYQKHDIIKELGEKCARKYGVSFYYRDFRPGFRIGQQGAKDMGLYRQKFCGCIISNPNHPMSSND